MSNSLIKLVSDTNNLEMMLIESEGQVSEAFEQALQITEDHLAEKVDSYSFILERFKALETYYKSKADKFLTVSKQFSSAQDRLKNNLHYAMDQLKVDEIQGTEMKFVKKPTQGTLEITDADQVPLQFKTEVITTEIDKKLLKEAAKFTEIPGAKFVPGYSIQAKINTPKLKEKS